MAIADALTEATMEWLLPYYWAVPLGPTVWWGPPTPCPAGSHPDGGLTQLDDLDVELVRIVYGVLVERIACGICGASLAPGIGVEKARGSFTATRTVAVAHCRGPRRHRHWAKVLEKAGDLQLGQLRPA